MVPVLSLWLPILLSAVAVFVVSSIIHMMLPYHKNDYAEVPNEDGAMDALRPFAIPPGDYVMPRPKDTKHMKSAEYQEKWRRGPVILMTVMPNDKFAMGAQLLSWFIYLVVINAMAAWLAGSVHDAGADYMHVFCTVGIAAFLGYGGALWQQSIWYKRKLSTTVKSTFDAVVFALVTAGFFGWLWPR